MRALVTGANGHIGFNLCKALLARGNVQLRASVRSLSDDAKITPLRDLGDFEIVAVDVRNHQHFAAALSGIDTLFHVAANYTVVTRGAEHELEIVRDSVEGVEVALRSAAAAGVEKVILTSSVATLPLVAPGGPLVTEADWLECSDVAYYRAKTEAERMAWRLAQALGIRLVAVLPGGVGGPGFRRRTPTIDLFEGIMLGSLRFGAPPGNLTYVDARDVANGHILAAEKDVTGRFILCDVQPSFLEYGRIMAELDPEIPRPPWQLPDFVQGWVPLLDAIHAKLLGTARLATREAVEASRGRIYNVSSERARTELGWTPAVPFRDSLRETMQAIRALRRSEGKHRMA